VSSLERPQDSRIVILPADKFDICEDRVICVRWACDTRTGTRGNGHLSSTTRKNAGGNDGWSTIAYWGKI
jgi:hypothetical protein